MPTEERVRKVKRVLDSRQPDLRVVLEGVTVPHNASAVMRTCDAAGVLHVDLISPSPELLNFNESISTGAHKWLETAVHASPAECLPGLKGKGFHIAAAHLSGPGVGHTDFDYARPVALVFGSESFGLSEEALAYADSVIRIPMLGMVQSLNLSVSVAVILFEAVRQRALKGYFNGPRLAPEEYRRLLDKWLRTAPAGGTGL